MIPERQKAVALTTAKENNQQTKTYLSPTSMSRAKLQIGELLLLLQTSLNHHQRQKYLQVFEEKLHRYLDLKFCGGIV